MTIAVRYGSVKVLIPVLLTALLLSSCGSTKGASIEIISPANDAAFASSAITVSVAVDNFTLVSQSSGGQSDASEDQNQGHIVYYLDVTPPIHYRQTALTQRGTYAVTTDTSYTWQNVVPGSHVVSAQLVTSDNYPLSVPVTASITITNSRPPLPTATPTPAPSPTATPTSTSATPGPTATPSPTASAVQAIYSPPKLSDAPADIQASVMRGYNLVNETQKYGAQYVGNGLNCSACHFSAGVNQDGKNGGLSLVGVAAKYPTLHGGAVTDLVERVNSCFLKSENGTPPPPDSEDMVAIIAYLHWISKDVPIYADIPWLGIDLLQSSHTADKTNGQKVFGSICAVCHGSSGEGNPAIVIDGVSPPPLFGPKSYNDAAGMAKPEVLAAFAYNNMPFKAPSLTMDEAIDVGAYVDSQSRPHFSKGSPTPTPTATP